MFMRQENNRRINTSSSRKHSYSIFNIALLWRPICKRWDGLSRISCRYVSPRIPISEWKDLTWLSVKHDLPSFHKSRQGRLNPHSSSGKATERTYELYDKSEDRSAAIETFNAIINFHHRMSINYAFTSVKQPLNSFNFPGIDEAVSESFFAPNVAVYATYTAIKTLWIVEELRMKVTDEYMRIARDYVWNLTQNYSICTIFSKEVKWLYLNCAAS